MAKNDRKRLQMPETCKNAKIMRKAQNLSPRPPSRRSYRWSTTGYRAADDAVEAVDDAMIRAIEAGGQMIKAAKKVFWGGYSGYFSDPDGHLWEVAYNPHSPVREDGTMEL